MVKEIPKKSMVIEDDRLRDLGGSVRLDRTDAGLNLSFENLGSVEQSKALGRVDVTAAELQLIKNNLRRRESFLLRQDEKGSSKAEPGEYQFIGHSVDVLDVHIKKGPGLSVNALSVDVSNPRIHLGLDGSVRTGDDVPAVDVGGDASKTLEALAEQAGVCIFSGFDETVLNVPSQEKIRGPGFHGMPVKGFTDKGLEMMRGISGKIHYGNPQAAKEYAKFDTHIKGEYELVEMKPLTETEYERKTEMVEKKGLFGSKMAPRERMVAKSRNVPSNEVIENGDDETAYLVSYSCRSQEANNGRPSQTTVNVVLPKSSAEKLWDEMFPQQGDVRGPDAMIELTNDHVLTGGLKPVEEGVFRMRQADSTVLRVRSGDSGGSMVIPVIDQVDYKPDLKLDRQWTA